MLRIGLTVALQRKIHGGGAPDHGGVPVIDTDEIAHRLTNPDNQLATKSSVSLAGYSRCHSQIRPEQVARKGFRECRRTSATRGDPASAHRAVVREKLDVLHAPYCIS